MSTINTSPYISYTHCSSYSSGEYRKKAGSDLTFAGGLDGPFINLKSHATYSSETSVTFKVHSLTLLCGSNAYWVTAKNAGVEKGYPRCGGSMTADDAVKPAC